MTQDNRIKLNKYQFAHLIDEVDGMCPLCAKELLIKKGGQEYKSGLAEAAHIYPHSPTEQEKIELSDVPRLSENTESLENLIMLCPNCHTTFDNPRTKEEYYSLYDLKILLMTRQKAKTYYHKHDIEADIIKVITQIGNINIRDIESKLSYEAMKVEEKMNSGASVSTKNNVIRDVREYYLEIEQALKQLEYEAPGVSDLIAKQVGLFYQQLRIKGFSQDEIYKMINDWINKKTKEEFSLVIPFITAFYIQNCEVFTNDIAKQSSDI